MRELPAQGGADLRDCWGAPELDDVHSRARELALALKRPRALLFALWGQWCDTTYGRVDLKQAQRLAAELRELGDTGGDVLIQGMGCWAGGMTCFFLGEFTAVAHTTKKPSPFMIQRIGLHSLS